MEIPDVEVFKNMQKVAAMEPMVKKVSQFIDNGEMDKRIKEAVAQGIKECPFYTQQKAKKAISVFVKWIIAVTIPVVLTFATLYASRTYAMKMYEKIIETKVEEVLEEKLVGD